MVRPIVLVFQEFAEVTVTPTTQDLNCLVIGPAYQIRDYPKDSAVLAVSDYGALEEDNPVTTPLANVPAITLAEPPDMEAGAWVDPASILVYFDEARVILDSGSDGTTVVTAPNENTFSAASATFQTDGVAAGDILIVDNPVGPATPSLVLTIMSVDSETVLRVTSNFTAAVAGTLNWRVERELAAFAIDSAYVNEPVFRASNEIEILGGVETTVSGVSRVVSYAKVYVAYRAYRTDLQAVDTVDSTDDIETKVGRIDARNPLAAGLFVAKQNAGTAPVQFYGVDADTLVGYTKAKDAISSDTSIYAIVPMTEDLAVHAMFKADNVTQADPTQALSTGVPQKFRVVIGATDLPETEDIIEETATATSEALAGAIPPGVKTITITSLTALADNLRPGDQLILSASENVASLDGTYTIAHINSNTQVELNEALPVNIGAAEGINYTVFRPSTNNTIVPLVDNRANLTDDDVTYYSLVAGITPGARTIAKVQDGTTPDGIHSIVEVAGVSTIINGDFGSGNVTAQMVVDALEDGTGVTVAFTGSVNLTATTSNAATAQTAAVAAALSTGTPGVDDLADTAVLDIAFIRLFDSAATFMTDGVLPGDIIEMPETPNGVFGSNVKRYEVASVVSEQRLQISNIVSGSYVNNTATVENELPHLDNRLGTGTVVSQGTMRYRVVRELTTTQQVTELVSRAQSLNSRRALMAWPNQVDVSGLVDNSKTANPDGSEAAADTQPGYYLGCAIGGMTAGLPSHQGFSRIGIAGVSRIYNSNDLFSESQLTDLSEGGLYVFMQNTPSALPYSIHQLTTDPSTLESGEYSIVKNFDFVSLFFLDILEPFLGQWNINNDTLGFMRQALNTGIENLKLRRVAKIGAPLNNATITSIAVSPSSADRVEIYMDVDLPKPLNVIGLHLVA
jgi:hypothetical protein